MTLRDCANIGQPNVVVTFKGPVSAFFHCGNSCVDTQEKLSGVVREQCVQLSVGGGRLRSRDRDDLGKSVRKRSGVTG